MRWALLPLLLLLAACAHRGAPAPDDGRFKMVHQVAVTHDDQQFLLTGYLLGKPNGDFRVSAAALMGPRIFDVARIGGQWRSKIHFAQLAEKLDPRHLGRSIDRIYFVDCGGALACAIASDDEVDRVEITRDASGAPLAKRFTLAGAPVLEVRYEEVGDFGGKQLAGKITLTHARYSLVIALEAFDPRPGFTDDLLEP